MHEGEGAVLAFGITLSPAVTVPVTVDYATADGSAHAGADYTAASGRLTFAPGETGKTVSVAVLDDAHDEGEETLTLGLSNPSAGAFARAQAVGTIADADALPGAWLAGFGRTVIGQVLDALERRFEASRSAVAGGSGFQLNLDTTRRENAGDDAEHGVRLRTTVHW